MEGRIRSALAVETRMGELGLTQQQLADKAGVDVKTLGNLLRRGKWPQARTRVRIEAALGWPHGEMSRLALPQREEPYRLPPETVETLVKDLGADRAQRVIAYVERLSAEKVTQSPG